MQVAALPRTLRICSRQFSAAAGGITSHNRSISTLPPASRTYHTSQPYRIENDSVDDGSGTQYINKRLFDPTISARDHPLSIHSLQSLAPNVPHIYVSRSSSPYFNLAVEYHLLTHSHPASRILFTYTNTPCVVIGRNQNPWVECDIAAITRGTSDGRDVELIRRRSGGGAVFHDEGNLNYTVIVPGDGFKRQTHVQMVVDALAWLGDKRVMFRRWKDVKANERNDIVASLQDLLRAEDAEEEWFKVSGTAFKLTRGRALHHGTLLHSSPYIDSIGSFLRSPGKDHITAKGVESVRSPVMNLWGTKNAKKRRDLGWTIRKTIQQKWVEKYAPGPVEEVQPIEIADDGIGDLVPELKAGIEELKTDAWRWEQTPGFSFDSRDVGSDGESASFAFEVKNGVIQSVTTSTALQVRYNETLAGQKIHAISGPGMWQAALTDEHLPQRTLESLLTLVEKCFPPVKKTTRTSETPQEPGPYVKPVVRVTDHPMRTKKPKRTGRDGAVDVERQASNAPPERSSQSHEHSQQILDATLRLIREEEADARRDTDEAGGSRNEGKVGST